MPTPRVDAVDPLGLALARAGVDRLVDRRGDEQWLGRAWSATDSRAVLVHDGRLATSTGPDGSVHLLSVAPEVAPEGERYLLGRDDTGTVWFGVRTHRPLTSASATLREVGAMLDARDAGLAAHATALANWHATHQHCPRCGNATLLRAAGAQRHCPSDGSDHFPRTDPAVIVLVTDPDDRALLGRQPAWPEGRYSTLAGFVEPGESAERAVVREVYEEAQVTVASVSYLASQPWPFPSSLMLAFRAHTAQRDDPVPDGAELGDVRWFTRRQLGAAIDSGGIRMPPSVSVSRHLVEHWYGEPLPSRPDGTMRW